MKDIKFSVIVPVYNVELYLRDCLESLLNQTFRNFEIILVDDGSTDKSGGMCDEYADKDARIKVLHKENGGPTSARVAGVQVAAGEYIACIDSDDWVDVSYLERFNAVVERYNPDIACCSLCRVDGQNESEVRLPLEEGYYSRADIENKIFPFLLEDEYGRSFSPSLCSKVFRKELFLSSQLSVDLSLNMGEDSAVSKPCVFHAQSLYVMDVALYKYRYNSTSLTNGRIVLDWNGPRIRGEHFERQIDLDCGNLRDQLSRGLTRALFTVAVSQFNADKKYREIARDIRLHLKDGYYAKVIKNCRFKFLKGKIITFILKHRLVLLVKMNNWRRFKRRHK